MFTGIIQNWAKVMLIEEQKHQMRLVLRFKKAEKRVQTGESIAVNGACLTAVKITPSGFTADIIPETRSATNLGRLKPGDWVNIERSLKAGDSVGGHFISGHVDGTGTIREIKKRGGNWSLLVHAPATIISQLTAKGSIACDGVSLTVQKVGADYFQTALIPHTLAVTTLGLRRPGDKLNLEIDMWMRQNHGKSRALSGKSLRQLRQELRRQGF